MESSESSDDAEGETRADEWSDSKDASSEYSESPKSFEVDSGHACACCHHDEASHDPSNLYPWLVGEGEKEEESNK
jgi:cytochrome c553